MKIFRYITRNTTKQIPCFGIAITDESFIRFNDICENDILKKYQLSI